jgi:alkylation response protein AidB-like acyl-CoA dehydrogenase
MDWADTPEQAAFRASVREHIEQSLPERYRPGGPGGEWQTDRASDDPERRAAATEWADALASRGWFAPAWPKEFGGAGLTNMEQFIYNHELARAEAPMVGGQAVTQIGPAVIIHGSDELKAEHLPRMLSGERAWCQGFSEPGAGSDLASLQTAARRDGDEYVVNGQKIWTSNAHAADWIALLVRSDPEAPKHRGISFLLVDMRSPGISIRPLINMAGEHGFNEVFFEDVRVPVEQRVGTEHRGWYVSVTLLDFERSRIRQAVDAQRAIDNLVGYLRTSEGAARSRVVELPSVRDAIVERAIEVQVAFNLAFRVVSMQTRGVVPNYEASMLQMAIFETTQRTARTAAKAFGLYGALSDPESPHAPLAGEPARGYVRSVSITIAGGSSEIQRNIIATRGLGLPRS